MKISRVSKFAVFGLILAPYGIGNSQTPKDEMIQKLPYKAWRGEAATNTLWVEVVRSGNHPIANQP